MSYRSVRFFPWFAVLAVAVLAIAHPLSAEAAPEVALLADVEPTGTPYLAPDGCNITCAPPPAVEGSHPRQLTAVGALTFFSAFEHDTGRELWVTDGTEAGTHRVADTCPGPCAGNPVLFGEVGGELLFWSATEGDPSPQVVNQSGAYWLSDGTPGGARELDGICTGDCHNPLPSAFVDGQGTVVGAELGDRLFFLRGEGDAEGGGITVWITDGSEAGTGPLTYVPLAGGAPLPVRSYSLQEATVVESGIGDSIFLVSDGTFSPPRDATLVQLGEDESVAHAVAGSCQAASTLRDLEAWFGQLYFLADCLRDSAAISDQEGLFSASGYEDDTHLLFSPPHVAGTTSDLGLLGPLGDTLYFVVNRTPVGGDLADGEGQVWSTPGNITDHTAVLTGLAPILDGDAHLGRLVWRAEGDDGTELWGWQPGAGKPPRRLASGAMSELTLVGDVWMFSLVDEAGDEPWVSDGTPNGTHRLADLRPGAEGSQPAGFTANGGQVFFAADDGEHGREPFVVSQDALGEGACVTGRETLCIADRFVVRVSYLDHHNGGGGVGKVVSSSRNAGFFWFFRESNVEVTVKVLDGRGVNGHWWVFWGGITDLEYEVEVYDRLKDETRTYTRPAGDLCGGHDTEAFFDGPPRAAGGSVLDDPAWDAQALDGLRAAAPASSFTTSLFTTPLFTSVGDATPANAIRGVWDPLSPDLCGTTDTQLCIGGLEGSFGVEVTYHNQFAGGAEGTGMVGGQIGDSGWFWFFDPENPELLVKVLYAGNENGHFWVFIGGLTTVDVDITITDTLTKGFPIRTYHKAAGDTCGLTDFEAFPAR